MKFYIVTPTFNALTWLQRCILSVADQVEEGVQVHHHVQDGGSTDGTPAWLQEWQQQHTDIPGYTFTFESAPDKGMYDAINTAWARMPQDADVTAHLNSDEQYLPQGLLGVAKAMQQHPQADIALASYFVVDAENRYICHRRPVRPQPWVSQTVCEIVTCACFHKASTFRRHGIRFEPCWRSIGDLVMYRDIVVNASPRYLVLTDVYTSTFSVTGSNLGWSAVTEREWPEYMKTIPFLYRQLRTVAKFWCNVKRRGCDLWHAAPRSYALYHAGETERTLHHVKRPTSHWGCRTEGER